MLRIEGSGPTDPKQKGMFEEIRLTFGLNSVICNAHVNRRPLPQVSSSAQIGTSKVDVCSLEGIKPTFCVWKGLHEVWYYNKVCFSCSK